MCDHCDDDDPDESVEEFYGRVIQPMIVEVVALPHPEAHLLFAGDVYGPDLKAVQLVYADDSGIWPWSRGHRGGVGGQPVLGPRAERRRAG
jgi:hypothetical protein